MARTALVSTSIVYTGVAVPAAAAANALGHKIANPSGRTWIEVINADASPITVTVQTQATYEGLAVADQTITVTNGTSKMIGPWKPAIYNVLTSGDADEGMVYVDFSAVTSITVRAWSLSA